ncbi:MAG: GAF domain-containing protein [Jatrophihabitantaceae bacterium]
MSTDSPRSGCTVTRPDKTPRPQLAPDPAAGVAVGESRIRELLAASTSVGSDLSLPVMLRRIAAMAATLVDARYAALAVFGQDGSLEHFVHAGIDHSTAGRIGAFPHRRGLLGLITDNSAPVRIADLTAHPAAAGFPAHHPSMRSFLGVPIQIQDEVLGNLYVTESAHGEFTAQDEDLLTGLAAAAGVALTNARLFQENEQQRLWLTASTELTQRLFAADHGQPLDLVLQYCMHGAAGDFAALAMAGPDNDLRIRASAGLLADDLLGRAVNPEHSLAGTVIRTGKPVLVTDYRHQVQAPETGDLQLAIDAAIGVPVRTRESQLGAIVVGRLPGRRQFTDTDRDQLAGFAAHAGIALELDRSRNEHEFRRLNADHERIAADLNNHVIRELFATGIGLQGLLDAVPGKRYRSRIAGYIDDLDAIIHSIRATVFELRPAAPPSVSLQRRIVAVAEQHTGTLGFTCGIRFAGPLDRQIEAGLAEDILAVIDAALAHIAHCSQATWTDVTVALAGRQLILDIADDGRSGGNELPAAAVTDLRQRAGNYGGTLQITAADHGGRHLQWSAQLAPEPPSTPVGA